MHFPTSIDLFEGTAFKPVEIRFGVMANYMGVEIPYRKSVVAKDFYSFKIEAILSGESIRFSIPDFVFGVIQTPILPVLQQVIAGCCICFERIEVTLRESLVEPSQRCLNPLKVIFKTDENLLFVVSVGVHALESGLRAGVSGYPELGYIVIEGTRQASLGANA